MSRAERYSLVARLLHWVVAIIIIGLILLGLYAEDLADSPFKIKLFFWHKSLGILVLGLVVVRIGWRLSHKPPAREQENTLLLKAAHAGHLALYLLMLLLPLSGWVIQSAANYPFQVFDLFALPSLVEPSKGVASSAAEVHEVAGKLLILLLLGHLLAVAMHRWVLKQDVFTRIALPKALGVLLLIAALGLLGVVTSTFYRAANQLVSLEGEVSAEYSPEITVALPASQWMMEQAGSQLGFIGTYDGVEFGGQFTAFDADIRFDPANLPGSRFAVNVDMRSVITRDDTRDEALAGTEWFDYDRFPLARFVAKSFSRQDDGRYIARGVLTIKEYSRPLHVLFEWRALSGTAARLIVSSEVLRLDYGVGSGLWTDPIVGHSVAVESALTLTVLSP